MTTVELLQQMGLNKYEAEAYYALLVHGSLTGYEVGKRSQVPLSRSYDVLEHLVEKGLALIQPGDPPRYLAQNPQQLLGQVRSSMEATLDALANALDSLGNAQLESEFWIARGTQSILQQIKGLIARSQTTLDLTVPVEYSEILNDELAQARVRGCQVFYTYRTDSQAYPSAGQDMSKQNRHNVLLLCDERHALVGTITAQPTSQIVSSTNPGLVTALQTYFEQQKLMPVELQSTEVLLEQAKGQGNNWMNWEKRKQHRLLQLNRSHRIA